GRVRPAQPAGRHRDHPGHPPAADEAVEMAVVEAGVTPEPEVITAHRPAGALLRSAMSLRRTQIGFLLVLLVVGIALLGPLLALVAIATLGAEAWLIVLAVGLTTMPRVARVIRGAAQPIVERDFVAAAEALGVPRQRILFGEILPNVLSPLMVEASLRLTYAI